MDRRVFICSPYQSRLADPLQRIQEEGANIRLAKAACQFAVAQNCEPVAPHLYFPEFLDDRDQEDRKLGMELGLTWLEGCDELWVFGNKISEGMAGEIARANELRIPIQIKWFVPSFPETELTVTGTGQ